MRHERNAPRSREPAASGAFPQVVAGAGSREVTRWSGHRPSPASGSAMLEEFHGCHRGLAAVAPGPVGWDAVPASPSTCRMVPSGKRSDDGSTSMNGSHAGTRTTVSLQVRDDGRVLGPHRYLTAARTGKVHQPGTSEQHHPHPTCTCLRRHTAGGALHFDWWGRKPLQTLTGGAGSLYKRGR
jgi:hypothetical protein